MVNSHVKHGHHSCWRASTSQAVKTLHLVRHAKSSWEEIGLEDQRRKLSPRGIADTKIMAQPIASAGCPFEHVYCSTARRAHDTMTLLAKHLDLTTTGWLGDSRLYTFDVEDLLAWTKQLEPKIDEVLIVAHNPALTDLVNLLGDRQFDNVPTCAYVQLKTSLSTWTGLESGCARTTVFLKPKHFK